MKTAAKKVILTLTWGDANNLGSNQQTAFGPFQTVAEAKQFMEKHYGEGSLFKECRGENTEPYYLFDVMSLNSPEIWNKRLAKIND